MFIRDLYKKPFNYPVQWATQWPHQLYNVHNVTKEALDLFEEWS